jgi:flavin reductase (DIM6/NTAB) family NADH-FMN oxidoreductase RutF
MKGFKEINVKNLSENVFRLFDDEWTLITAGNIDSFNTMTASWGGMGILWNKPIAICFIRPQRFTFQFTERASYFTLSFFNKEYRNILDYCGSHSGRDNDKVKETGLLPLVTKTGNISFQQASLVFECRKLYSDFLVENNFIVKELIRKNYPNKDFHRFYIGEIEKCYLR